MLKFLFILIAPSVIDGDTLGFVDADGVRHSLRLAGASAPELAQPGGLEARLALAALVGAQTLDCDISFKGSFGRFVGACTLPDGRDLGCELIRSGELIPDPVHNRNLYAACRPPQD